MQLIIHPVDGKNADELIKYSSAYGPEHDESYLPDHSFKVSEEQPSYLLYDEQKVVGAVSLLRTPRYLSTSQARFSIFHSMLNSVEAYKTLFQAVQPDMQDLERAFLFLPEQNRATIGILKSLGFSIERFAFVLMNKHPEQKPVEFPLQFELIPLERGNDVRLRQFAGCLNELGQGGQALEYLGRILELVPGSEIAQAAENMIHLINQELPAPAGRDPGVCHRGPRRYLDC